MIEKLNPIKNSFIWGNTEELNVYSVLDKVIDAKDSLSVQVHPTDDVAKRFGKEKGKSKYWYILQADEDAALYYGFNKDMTIEEIELSLKDNSICDDINKIPVKAGDGFWVPAGLVHAILKGVKLLEVQNQVDLTYRFYDYGRLDASGNARELHIEESLASSYLKSTPIPKQAEIKKDGQFNYRELVKTGLFNLTEIEGKGAYTVYAKKTDVYVYDVLKNAHYSIDRSNELTFNGDIKLVIAEVR